MTIYTISEVELEQSDGDFDKGETSSVQNEKGGPRGARYSHQPAAAPRRPIKGRADPLAANSR